MLTVHERQVVTALLLSLVTGDYAMCQFLQHLENVDWYFFD